MHGPTKAKIANKKFNAWLQKRGYKVIGKEFSNRVQSGGWPDFLVQKHPGKYEFFEVKSGKHKLDHHQFTVLKILRKLGKVSVLRLDEKMKEFKDETPKSLR